jgi:hypothetical protein
MNINDKEIQTDIEIIEEGEIVDFSNLGYLQKILTNSKWTEILKKSIDIKNKRTEKLKLNFFNLTSDFYYRENYHSDFLKAFLENSLFLKHFIENLNKLSNQIFINSDDYLEAEIYREIGKIDLWIRDKQSKKSIVIENKINNAVDMERQVPRYVEYVIASDYLIDAVIYLSLDGIKKPFKGDWTEHDQEIISQKILLLGAFDGSNTDLYSVFQLFESTISDIDYLVLSRQYRNLLSTLSISTMNKPVYDDFYQLCLKDENFTNISELSSLYNQLSSIRAQKIQENFKSNCSPFEKVGIWRSTIAYFDNYSLNSASNFAIDITCLQDKYVVEFFDRNSLENDFKSAMEFLHSKGIKDFKSTEGKRRVETQFLFPKQENELYSFLNEILSKLNM